ncbi:MAG: hypothetical protein HYZ28_03625 [Myxococcales bacterium]|nr:hypothetical protein [Myxococcales bacterium]
MFFLASLPLVLLQAVSVSPTSAPASGQAEAVVKVDRAGMVRLLAKSRSGTSCEVVDHLRGPFARSGSAGVSNCELDLLLDAGTYKLRLLSKAKARGKVEIGALAFTEANQPIPRLEPQRSAQRALPSGEQASYWIRLEKRQPVTLRVSGRTAGAVRLWRNGEWLETAPFRGAVVYPQPGQGIHEWWLEAPIDTGDYLLTVYGTDARPWTRGKESDAVSVEYGFRPAPVERSIDLALPEWGMAAISLPKQPAVAFASLEAPGPEATQLSLHPLSEEGASAVATAEGACRIEPKALVPECAAHAGMDARHVLLVRGAPGTRVHLEWAALGGQGPWRDGFYGSGRQHLTFRAEESGEYLVGLHDVPLDEDSPPLSCELARLAKLERLPLGRDFLKVGPERPIEREFNYLQGATIWFELEKGGRYRIQTQGGRKSRCELFRVDGAERKRLTETDPKSESCDLALTLSPGPYDLALYGGIEGIEKLIIREDSQRAPRPSPTKSSCLNQRVRLEAGADYQLSVNTPGRASARGLVAARLPLALASPLHLTVDPRGEVKLPLAQGPVVVRSSGGRPFACAGGGASVDAKDGTCRLEGTDSLALGNSGTNAVSLTIFRPRPETAPPPLAAYRPTPAPLARVPLDTPTFFDFDRGESHSMVFDVERPGLYHVTTLGLLSTSCRLRTPVEPSLSADTGGGRGRNCLVAGYLKPGRYMLTVTAQGQSKGRAAALLKRRSPKESQPVAADGEAFLRVEAGDLIQQRLTVKSPGRYALATSGQGVSLQCRLDDKDGWPLLRVPTPCTQELRLRAGQLLWTQLPLTVESMRHTQLRKVRRPARLTGAKAHPVQFHTWYTAVLGKDGKDELTFELEGELEVAIALTSGMQGRLFAHEKEKRRPVEVIPPQEASAPRDDSEPEESEGGGYEGEGYEGEGESYEGEETSGEPRPSGYQPLLPQAPPPAPGHRVTLPPGKYLLVTEHSRGDVAIEYRLHLGSDTLLPGMTRELPVPARLPVKMPRDGTVRLRTEGETDVRCRLFDGERLVFEGSDNGADWNCVLAEPLRKGLYTLVIEAETQAPGATRLALTQPKAEELGPLSDGQKLKLGSDVAVLDVPLPEQDAVEDLTLRSKSPFSCALENAGGEVVFRLSRVRDCSALVRPGGEKHRLRLWTTDGAAAVTASLLSRPIGDFAGAIPAAKATRASVPRPGRYRTSPQVFCLGAASRGVLRECGPEVSLEAGPWVFSARGPGAEPRLPLEEVTTSPEAEARPLRLSLSRAPFIQAAVAKEPSIHLLSATVSHGERVSPSCAIDSYGDGKSPGVRARGETACHAASGVALSAIERLWVPSEEPVEAKVVRLAVPVPQNPGTLSVGRQRLSWRGSAALFRLPPASRSRVELTQPRESWAVLLDGAGRAMDVCAPELEMSRCVLSAQGGQLFIHSPGESTADATVVLLDAPERVVSFTGLHEEAPRLPGTVRLRVPAAEGERFAQVEGASRCVVVLDDGVRLSSCRATVPAGIGAELLIDYAARPYRAVVHVPGRDKWARLGVELPAKSGPALGQAVAIPASGALVDRVFELPQDAVVRIRSDSGVCGLFRGNDLLAADGLDAGCELTRLVSAGTYRFLVRPFDKVPLTGTLSWTAEPVSVLADGVGPEEWISPSEVRLYRFATASAGKIGLGLQVQAERLDCQLFDDGHRLLGEGCQQYLSVEKGSYLLAIRAPASPGARPLRYRPVLLGLAGAKTGVPEEYLRDFFNRIGANP